MFEQPSTGSLNDLSGAELLSLAVDRLLVEDPAGLPGEQALRRLRSVIVDGERLQAARLSAVRDMELRELFALDGAGSTRGWLRAQLGGEQGQLADARRLRQHAVVAAGLAAGELSGRAASQLWAVLDKVPAAVPASVLQAVLLDGVGGLLKSYTGGLVLGDAVTDELLAARAEVQAVLDACAADVTATPAAQLEPALVLLARRLSPAHLGPALRMLLTALLPDGSDGDTSDPYYVELRELLDGDVDLRGHLDAETGQALASEIERRLQQARRAAAQQGSDDDDDADAETRVAAGAGVVAEPAEPAEPDAAEPAEDTEPAEPVPAEPAEHSEPLADGFASRICAGRERHDALGQLLRDVAGVRAGSGERLPTALTLYAPLDAVEGRLGALPGMLATGLGAAPVSTTTLQRMGCHSELNVVLLDALGNPVGASGSHRNATRRERQVMRVQWGPTCAVAGCSRPDVIPHHAEPWWKTRRTRQRDLIPLCEHDHRNVHEGHRVLRLRDGRLLDEHGWVVVTAAA